MFAPKAAKSTTTKAAAGPAPGRRAPQGRSIGNQAMLRLQGRHVQAKLIVGPADDPLEHEADRVADAVMRMPDLAAAALGHPDPNDDGTIRRACAACQSDDNEAQVHAKRIDPDDKVNGKRIGERASVPSGLEQDIRGLDGGRPLPAAARGFFEPRLRHDFSAVRVHAGPDAASAATALGARAFTLGPHIAFAAGQYAPDSETGRHLLAHELAHVVQQGRSAQGPVRRDFATPPPAKPQPAQPDLNKGDIARAIAANKASYDADRTKQIQGLVGTEQTGVWKDEDIVMIASIQEEHGLIKNGIVGPDTFKFLDREVTAEKLDKTDANCLLSFSVTQDPVQVGPLAGGSKTITEHFRMRAQFSEHCGCGDYEYRQFIRGHWRTVSKTGVVTDHSGEFTNQPGGAGLTEDFREDGNIQDRSVSYGHRDGINEGPGDGYFDDAAAKSINQPGGCFYSGEDRPGGGIAMAAGDVADVLIAFRGEIRRKGTVVETKEWTAISGKFPA